MPSKIFLYSGDLSMIFLDTESSLTHLCNVDYSEAPEVILCGLTRLHFALLGGAKSGLQYFFLSK